MGLCRFRLAEAFAGLLCLHLVSSAPVWAQEPEPPPDEGIAATNREPAPQRGPHLLSLEIDFQKGVSSPQNDVYGPGLSAALLVEYPLTPWLLVGGRIRGGFLFDGPAPSNPSADDPGWGYQVLLMPSARFRPLGSSDSPERGTGFFADVAIGGGVDEGKGVAALELGLGYTFALGNNDLGPVFRYSHLFHGGSAPNDLSLIVFGMIMTFGDRRPEIVEAAPEYTWRPDTQPRDADGDGLAGGADGCPHAAEDVDGFEDEDGCPDFDNDGDGVLDRDDACPNEAEDADGFEDDDGCPEADNDADGVFDDADECPDAQEVVNGVSDEDGCPDTGVITLREGRFVIEDRLLFTGNSARLGRGAARVLDALAAIAAQHPEWAGIRIESHVEARGDAARNQRLSAQRAEAVRAALVARGVPEARMIAEGLGATVAREGTASSRRNRRVEVVVLTQTAP